MRMGISKRTDNVCVLQHGFYTELLFVSSAYELIGFTVTVTLVTCICVRYTFSTLVVPYNVKYSLGNPVIIEFCIVHHQTQRQVDTSLR